MLLPVKDGEQDTWTALLKMASSWSDAYKADGKWVDARANQNPLAGSNASFHSWFEDNIADGTDEKPEPVTSDDDMDVVE